MALRTPRALMIRYQFTHEQLFQNAIQDDVWVLGNKVLYQLCQDHPKHDQMDAVIAKVWLIGRAYAAAVERRKKQIEDDPISSSKFYTDKVAPTLINSQLDARIDVLRPCKNIQASNMGGISGATQISC